MKRDKPVEQDSTNKVVEEQVEQSPKPRHATIPALETVMHKPALPYPQRFQKKKMDAQFTKFLDIFNKLQINIPFSNALEQMPIYVEFMKDILYKKRRLWEFEIVNLMKEYSAIL